MVWYPLLRMNAEHGPYHVDTDTEYILADELEIRYGESGEPRPLCFFRLIICELKKSVLPR